MNEKKNNDKQPRQYFAHVVQLLGIMFIVTGMRFFVEDHAWQKKDLMIRDFQMATIGIIALVVGGLIRIKKNRSCAAHLLSFPKFSSRVKTSSI